MEDTTTYIVDLLRTTLDIGDITVLSPFIAPENVIHA
jgi:hypothetical protein